MYSNRRFLTLIVLLASFIVAPVKGQTKKAVAVLRFDNNTGEARYDHLGRGLGAMMISDLSAVEQIQLVERERLEELLQELDFQQLCIPA